MAISILLTGCSASQSDPCKLLTVAEAQRFDPTIAKHVWMPEKKGETREAWKNELCLYHDDKDEARLMMFVYGAKAKEPVELVDAAMQRGTSQVKIVEVSGAGEKAAAGFRDGTLRTFVAGNKSRRVAFLLHSSDAIAEGDERIETLRALANAALAKKK